MTGEQLTETLSLKVRTVRQLQVTVDEGVITLKGVTGRYYFKQLAQHSLVGLLNDNSVVYTKIANEIEVVPHD